MVDLPIVSKSVSREQFPWHARRDWRLPTYSPTSLNQHANCPEAFLHDRVLKTPPSEQEISGALAKGSAVHRILDQYVAFDSARRDQFVANLVGEASRALAAEGMGVAQPGFEAASTEVAEYAAAGIDVLQNEFGSAQVLIGEQFLDLRRPNDPMPFRLAAKVDLLALFPDGSVESLDWKTGAHNNLDQLQNIICRLVTQANVARIFADHLYGGLPTAIRTTVCHLRTRTLAVQEFEQSQLIAEFSNIRMRIASIEQAKVTPEPGTLVWRPQPGPLCNWCKYAHACSYFADSTDGEAMAWLDEAPDPVF